MTHTLITIQSDGEAEGELRFNGNMVEDLFSVSFKFANDMQHGLAVSVPIETEEPVEVRYAYLYEYATHIAYVVEGKESLLTTFAVVPGAVGYTKSHVSAIKSQLQSSFVIDRTFTPPNDERIRTFALNMLLENLDGEVAAMILYKDDEASDVEIDLIERSLKTMIKQE